MNKQLSIILPVHNERESLEIMIRLLNSTLNFEYEIIVVYDEDNDNSIDVAKKLEKDFQNFRLIQNRIGKGVRNAIQQGVKESKYEVILITAVDEIFPIIAIDTMLEKIVIDNFDLVSGTRYSLGGKRLGGSVIGTILSILVSSVINPFFNGTFKSSLNKTLF